MTFSKPVLVVFGGNNGQTAENDIWVLDVERSPFVWREVTVMVPTSPLPRVYHSAEVCRHGPAAGMMVTFGGRTANNCSLKDIWGLRQHRDGRWDWVHAPDKRGNPPLARFQHTSVFHSSKLLVIGGRGSEVSTPLPTAMYDTETCEWKNYPSSNRFRHSSWGVGSVLYCYGGFDHRSPSAPTKDLQVLDISRASIIEDVSAETGQQPTEEAWEPPRNQNPQMPPTVRETRQGPQPVDAVLEAHGPRVANMVHVVNDHTDMVRQVDIATLAEEGRRLAGVAPTASANDVGGIANLTIDGLLKPSTWEPDPRPDFFLLNSDEVSQLCDEVLQVLQQEPMVLKVRAPIKVYGDIHGQYGDLMRLFGKYNYPTDGEGGDIETTDYLFLGDYVDRGNFSLEVMCVLLALKVKYPKQIHLLRGNHEDPMINSIYGFKEECKRRLREDPDEPYSCWNKFNYVFEWMPVGAVIDSAILCIHGGIGGSIENLAQLEALERPLQVAQVPQTDLEQRVTDLLWSDPTDNDNQLGVIANLTRDSDGQGRIKKFGPDRVDDFLKQNHPLKLIVRAHECVMDGFERFANGKLITLFSATDYCGTHKNAGALLFIRRDLTVVPKLIYPVNSPQTRTWDNSITEFRPPTPPRPAAPRQ